MSYPDFKAPQPLPHETHDSYLMRLAQAFETWANGLKAALENPSNETRQK